MSKLICPNCGVYTSFSALTIEGSGILKEQSSSDKLVFDEVSISAIAPYTYVYGDESYAILVCQACREYFVARREKYADADDWLAVYPIQHKTASEQIPEPIKGEFDEANLCFAVGTYLGCLLVCKTVLIALQREQGVSNIKELKEKGIISNMLYNQADQVRRWANMFAHEDVPEDVTKEDCEQLLTYLEALLNAVYVEPKRLSSITHKGKELRKNS